MGTCILDNQKLERIQHKATRIISSINHYLSYHDRLGYLNLPSLQYRRRRGDLIYLYCINFRRALMTLPDHQQVWGLCASLFLLSSIRFFFMQQNHIDVLIFPNNSNVSRCHNINFKALALLRRYWTSIDIIL